MLASMHRTYECATMALQSVASMLPTYTVLNGRRSLLSMCAAWAWYPRRAATAPMLQPDPIVNGIANFAGKSAWRDRGRRARGACVRSEEALEPAEKAEEHEEEGAPRRAAR